MTETSVIEEVLNLVTLGGWVMIPIFLIGWFAWVLLIERYFYFRVARGNSVRKFWNLYETKGENAALRYLKKSPRGFFLKLVEAMRRYRDYGPEAVRNGMDAARHEASLEFSKSLRTIAVCASVAPMLGLLGTVTGMVHTFETIQQFGFGNPVLLADGISEALLTTQAGLLVAFPLMLAHNYLTEAIGRTENEGWGGALRYESVLFPEKEAA
ncbi:MAG: MotA/TolQ/ExbB proton channel family protein [Fibrobacteraceae bacterium]